MRDINRIDKILKEFSDIWKTVPDLRLMQLISNFQIYIGSDCFPYEDDSFIEKLKAYVDTIRCEKPEIWFDWNKEEK